MPDKNSKNNADENKDAAAGSTSEPGTNKEKAPVEQDPKDENGKAEEDKTVVDIVGVINIHKPSSRIIDKNAVKKKGFLRANSAGKDYGSFLEAEIKQIQDRYNKSAIDYEAAQRLYIASLRESNGFIQIEKDELRKKRDKYEKRVENEIPVEWAKLEAELKDAESEVFRILKEIGKEKENIVATSIEKLGNELQSVIKLNRQLQDEQNRELSNEFDNDKTADGKKIKFLESILTTYQEHYNRVTERLKILSRDGMNGQIAGILILLGTLGALVSGWWFSLWTGAQSEGKNNLPGETNVKLFFLDNISKFLSYYSFGDIIGGLLIYITSVGVLAWICYILLIRFGFINDNRKKKKGKKGQGADANEEIRVDLQEDDELLKIKLGGNNWLALWLKIAPFIFAFVPLLAIIAKQVAAESALLGRDKVSNFQNLFDSLANQFIGTCIAFSFATFALLYFTRVTERKYYKEETEVDIKNGRQKRGDFTFYIGIIFFISMVFTMFIYQKFGISDIRQVAVIGFLVSCVATGFSLGYGYLFQSMQENAEYLLARIDIISTLINNYSKPARVNYTTNGLLRARIYYMQKKVMDLIQNRQEMAIAVAGGYDMRYETVNEKKEESNKAIEEDEKKDTAPDKPANGTAADKPGNSGGVIKNVLDFIKLKWLIDREDKETEEKRNKIVYKITGAEINYFSEKAQQLGVNNDKVKELKNKLEKLETEKKDYLRNEGTLKAIGDQLQLVHERGTAISDEINKIESDIVKEKEKLTDMSDVEKTLFEEGFYTGIWLKQSGNDAAGLALVHDTIKLN